MSRMSTRTPPPILESDWTAEDLFERFGPIPLSRIRLDPAPGLATEEDVSAIFDAEKRLYELVEGVLVEKAVGVQESYLAIVLASLLAEYLTHHPSGFVLGADGMARLAPGLIRIPDVSFVSWERLPSREVPEGPFLTVAPDLAVEVLSPSNTTREMDRKLQDYFGAGVRLVWFIDPMSRTVRVFEIPEDSVTLGEAETLDGGVVLPGFAVVVSRLFEGMAARRGPGNA